MSKFLKILFFICLSPYIALILYYLSKWYLMLLLYISFYFTPLGISELGL